MTEAQKRTYWYNDNIYAPSTATYPHPSLDHPHTLLNPDADSPLQDHLHTQSPEAVQCKETDQVTPLPCNPVPKSCTPRPHNSPYSRPSTHYSDSIPRQCIHSTSPIPRPFCHHSPTLSSSSQFSNHQ